ncbi:hypothetical protein [Streptomyces sp. BH104]|uniref:hypothetical protein n=1 Tax=Streptomyces sp. BH104 TaxID=3410407 RepID=UPI003BB7FA75
MTAPAFPLLPDVVAHAVSYGLADNPDGGLMMLQPYVEDGPSTTYQVLVCLAEAALIRTRQEHRPTCEFGMRIETLDGDERSTDDLSPGSRFAAQFVTAWANLDEDTTSALFMGLAARGDREGGTEIGEAVRTLFGFAVATAAEIRADIQAEVRECRTDDDRM